MSFIRVHYVVRSGLVNVSSRTRDRIVAALAAAAWLAIGFGAFQTFYLRIWTEDRAALRAQYSMLWDRRIPGLRELLENADAQTPAGARILIALPHRPWQSGYGYGFRRAQYVLQGKEAIPLLDRVTDRVDERALEHAEYVLCWRQCPEPPGFRLIWQSDGGMLFRRTP